MLRIDGIVLRPGQWVGMTVLGVLFALTNFAMPQDGPLRPANRILFSSQVSSDASRDADYIGGTAVSPSGNRIGVTKNYLTLNGQPWLPVMGEFHFSRYPEDDWEDEILKMKAGGVQIISTYVIWIHHEEIEGTWDWSGQRNLRHFVELCKKHGMYVYPRIGPWVHAEVRNGGLPDWILKESTPRENDPHYLSFVDAFDHQIAMQLQGLLWKDGGPVIGIQIENEYANRKPNAGAAHILELKRLARSNGLDVPLYTVTGWDSAIYPEREVLPVYGAYADAPWDPSDSPLPPNEAYAFRFDSRVSGNMGAIPSAGFLPKETDPPAPAYSTPFLTAEVGAGIQDTYHRRPILDADDVASIPEVLIGSGANLLGYYMFHGGENPQGKQSTLNESRATHYATDVPVKSYDFQAPLGEFGQKRPSFDRLKLLNYFLNDFGTVLALMRPDRPSLTPTAASDLSAPRVSARTSPEGGFLFVNNYVRGASVPARHHLQIELHLNGETVIVPDAPVDVPSGGYFIWPVGLDMGGNHLSYSTAQLFTKIDSGDLTTYFFFVVPGIEPVFTFSNAKTSYLAMCTGKHQEVRNHLTISNLKPSHRVAIEFRRRGSARRIQIVLLTRVQAEQLTKVVLKDGIHLVSFAGTVFTNGGKVYLRSTAASHFHFASYPDFSEYAEGDHTIRRLGLDGIFQTYDADVPRQNISIQTIRVAPRIAFTSQFNSETISNHPGIQSPPSEAAFSGAPRWKFQLSSNSLAGLSNLFLEISYRGNIARFSAGDDLLSDNFYNGKPWTVGLHSFATQLGASPAILTILPLQPGNDVVLEDSARLSTVGGPVFSLDHVSAIPEYQLILDPR